MLKILSNRVVGRSFAEPRGDVRSGEGSPPSQVKVKLRSQSQVGLPSGTAASLNTQKKQLPLVLGRADPQVYEGSDIV